MTIRRGPSTLPTAPLAMPPDADTQLLMRESEIMSLLVPWLTNLSATATHLSSSTLPQSANYDGSWTFIPCQLSRFSTSSASSTEQILVSYSAHAVTAESDLTFTGNARIAGLTEDLKLEGYDYNVILSVFYISYILFEIPATVTCKWMGPGWFLPATSLAFGIVSIATAFVKTQAAICGVRFLLGIFEAGMLPGIAYYLSRWYKRAELTFRLSLYMVMAPLAGAFGGLLASGILKLDHFGGLHDWRMIFAIEGIITIILSLMAFFTLTDRPETAWWLSKEEKELCIARVKSERLAQTEVLDGIDRAKLWRGVSNPITLQIAFIFLFNNITVQGLAFFLPTIVGTIYPDYSTVQKQLYSVPPYAVGAFFALAFPALSWYLDKRQIFIILSAPTVIAGYAMFLGSKVAEVRYGACFMIASTCMVLGTMTNAHISANVVSDTARSSAIGLNVSSQASHDGFVEY